MFINIQVDKLEMEALQQTGTEVHHLVTIMTTALGGKTKIGEFEIPTISVKKSKKFGNFALDCSPTALNLAITVEPKFVADVLTTYVKVYGKVAIPMVQLIAAIVAMDSQMEAAEKELKKNWFTKPKKEKGKAKKAA